MSEPVGTLDPAVEALVANEAAAQDRIADNLVNAILLIWAGFSAFYAGDAVAAFGARVAQLVTAAQRSAGTITEAHLRQQMQRMGYPLTSVPIVELPRDLRLGAETADVYQRPIRQIRYLLSTDVPLAEAVQEATNRLETLARTDLQVARRDASQQVLYAADTRVTGYRRVIHPELSESGTCGLCIAASDRVYSKKELLPLHDNCVCTTIPVIGQRDPGDQLNAQDLAKLYAEAGGSTSTAALKRTRYKINENGELGPVLTFERDDMKGPREVKRQLSDRAREARKAQLQRQIGELQARENRSQWHQDRLEQLQELLDVA